MKKVSPVSEIKSENPSVLALKSRADYQIDWEAKHEGYQTSIDYIWPMTIPKRDINEVYIFDKVNIGAGHFGSVRKAKNRIDRSKTYAIKTVNKSKLKGDISMFKNELDMLRFSDHPNIVQFFEIYQDNANYYFVMEYCQGGDIACLIEKTGALEEVVARKIVYQALLAINNLHSCGIVHRDVKADNFLFTTSDLNSPLKLIDFGLSKRFQPGAKMTTMVGTPLYVAPEIVDKRGYTEKCDIWSIGVVMYMILAANFPFRGNNNNELFERIRKGEYSMLASKQLLACSQEGKLFLKRLLERNSSRRYSARAALRDPWFTQLNIERNDLGKAVISKDLLQKLQKFKEMNTFSKEVIRLLVMLHDDDPQVQNLKHAFFYIDLLNNGFVDKPELKKIFEEHSEAISIKEVEEIILSLGIRTKRVISYTSFLTATVQSSFYLNDDYLEEVFKRFDLDQDNLISIEDITESFARFGVELHKSYIKTMIEEFGSREKISFKDFVSAMKNNSHSSAPATEGFESQRGLLQKDTDLPR